MDEPNSKLNENEVSPRLKVAVIGLTILTLTMGIIFFVLVFKRVFSDLSEDPVWGAELLVVAEKLQANGLKKQAAEQFEKFLDKAPPDPKTRADVSFKIAQIYRELNDCAANLTWLYQVEAADSQFPEMEQVRKFIASAQKECTIQ